MDNLREFSFNYKAIIHYHDHNVQSEESDGGFWICKNESAGTWLLPDAKNLKLIKEIELRFFWEYNVHYPHDYQLYIIK